MIVPLSLMGDISVTRARRHLLLTTRDLEADCFPQKDNARRRVFADAKLSTVVITARRSSKESWADSSDTCSRVPLEQLC